MKTASTEADEDDFVSPDGLATPKQVRLLEGFNYRREAVRKWTHERAETVLKKCQQEQRLALRRADNKAREQDGERGQPSEVERVTAARYVEQMIAQKEGAEELMMALMYSLWVCSDEEIHRLAGYLVKLWTTEKAKGAA